MRRQFARSITTAPHAIRPMRIALTDHSAAGSQQGLSMSNGPIPSQHARQYFSQPCS
jgi:hypothetical protein